MQVDPYAATNALSEGFNQQQAMAQSRARRMAGNALAGGNTQAAMSALGGAGDLAGQRVLQNDMTAEADAVREQEQEEIQARRTWMLQGVTALEQAPPDQVQDLWMTQLRPVMAAMGMGEDELRQLDAADKSPESLRAVRSALGGELPNPGVGYRNAPGGRQEYIPGGPADPVNQRWQVTASGMLIPPPGWSPPDGGGQGGEPEYIDELPPGVRPRPNQPPSARPATGGGERSQPVSVSFQSSRDAQAAIMNLVPGVTVTSGARSPADNARVGGARGSFHLQDRARDLVPPSGMTMGQLAAKMRQAGFRALDEGDHVHVSW